MATIGVQEESEGRKTVRRRLSAFADLVGNSQSIRVLEITSVIALVAVATATVWLLKGEQTEPLYPAAAAALLVANLLPATCLLVLFGRRVALKRAEQGNIGNKHMLHVRLVAIFSLIATVPTLLLVIFASVLFQSGAQFWFSGSARGMLENAGELAKGYYDEKVRDVGAETVTMAGDIRFILSQVRINSPEFLETAYPQQVLNRKLSESAIVTIGDNGQQNTEAVFAEKARGNWISADALKKLESGQNFVVSVTPDHIDAVVVLFDQPRSYLYVRRAETVPSFALGERAQSVLNDYEDMAERSRRLQLQFNIALYGISLLVIGTAVWVALLVADRLVRPVTNLVQAAQKIADGDLSVRVDEDPDRFDEVASLSQSFNVMTNRLQSQTSALIATNEQLDTRRAFMEAVLESISAGVVSLDQAGTILLANSTAEKLLARDGQGSIVGQSFAAVSPILAELAAEKPRGVVQIGDGPEPQTVAVKISDQEDGKVVTFEDISQQLADQRRAAWSDVARRIAHEIKNPLTPIQLAAERLKRRFGKQIDEGADVFEQLTGTIVRQVGDLRNIVDEFSSFARMPKPLFRSESLNDIVSHAVFLFEVAHTDIKFSFENGGASPMLICDRRQLGQAITNILKNAVESIAEKKKQGLLGDHEGRIEVILTEEAGRITLQVRDNGMGLPADRDRIVEPYVTTRATGSGLGLAIVKKIVEEHFADIAFTDTEGGGATVTLTFSPETVEAKVGVLLAGSTPQPKQAFKEDQG